MSQKSQQTLEDWNLKGRVEDHIRQLGQKAPEFIEAFEYCDI